MDGLALFCNLCADGPVTLRRLRAAGVRELGDLERIEPATLALWLHASLPQALAFAAEAHKLARRLAEPRAPAAHVPAPETPAERRPAARSATGVPLSAAPPARETRLVPGLLSGLDVHVCTRLAEHGVRTTRALAERAGLDLARRSGVPYSALLALAREARRHAGAKLSGARAVESTEPVREFVPFRPAPAPREPEPALPEAPVGDAFTLPVSEPESAGPFG